MHPKIEDTTRTTTNQCSPRKGAGYLVGFTAPATLAVLKKVIELPRGVKRPPALTITKLMISVRRREVGGDRHP